MSEITISAADVNKLRQTTGAGMMDCKKALTEAAGDFEAAIDILRKKGQKVSAARADRETTEGSVFVNIASDNSNAQLVALGCETDFVAKNDGFQNLGKAILAVAVANNIADKDVLLVANMTDGRPVSEHITDLIGKIGEKISVVAYEAVAGDQVGTYIHSNGKVGVLVAFVNTNGTNVEDIGKDIAMQIAAMKPLAVDENAISAELIAREKNIVMEQMAEDPKMQGKPAQVLEQIAAGKLNAFFKENTLMAQVFVKDSSMTIAQLLEKTSKGMAVSTFKRIALG